MNMPVIVMPRLALVSIAGVCAAVLPGLLVARAFRPAGCWKPRLG